MNYAAHNKELHHSLKLSEPTIFMKSDSSLLKDGKPFFIPDFSSEIHYETEIVVKIDRLGKNIAERFAHRYYNEVTVGIDFTARDLQNKLRAQGLPWEISKAFDNSAVLGTFVPLERVGDVNRIPFHLDINGKTVQEGNTQDMLFPVDKIIAYVSRFFTLKIGDLIYTGTPGRRGAGQDRRPLAGIYRRAEAAGFLCEITRKKRMKRILCVLLFVFGLLTSAWADSSRYASESVLNSGKWVKIQVAEDGIYKLTAADLKKMGFSNLDKVAVYGYGGWPLDEDFSTTYIDDVPEVAVWRGADYLLFYGKGPRKWEYSFSDKSFIHTNNPYSNYGYYFVTEKETAGRTMEKAASAAGATLQVTTFDDYVLHEEELVSVNSSGRELYGESFTSTLSRDFTISVPGITNDEGKATLSFYLPWQRNDYYECRWKRFNIRFRVCPVGRIRSGTGTVSRKSLDG